MEFPIELRAKPEVDPIIITNASEYLNGNLSRENGIMLIKGKSACEIYKILRNNPDKEFTRSEAVKVGGKKFNSASEYGKHTISC